MQEQTPQLCVIQYQNYRKLQLLLDDRYHYGNPRE